MNAPLPRWACAEQDKSRFKSYPCYLLVMRPRANFVTFLCLHFFFFYLRKVEITELISQSDCKN